MSTFSRVEVIFVKSYAFTYLSLVFFFQIQMQIHVGFLTEYSCCSISESVKKNSCWPVVLQACSGVQPDCNRLVAPLDPGHLWLLGRSTLARGLAQVVQAVDLPLLPPGLDPWSWLALPVPPHQPAAARPRHSPLSHLPPLPSKVCISFCISSLSRNETLTYVFFQLPNNSLDSVLALCNPPDPQWGSGRHRGQGGDLVCSLFPPHSPGAEEAWLVRSSFPSRSRGHSCQGAGRHCPWRLFRPRAGWPARRSEQEEPAPDSPHPGGHPQPESNCPRWSPSSVLEGGQPRLPLQLLADQESHLPPPACSECLAARLPYQAQLWLVDGRSASCYLSDRPKEHLLPIILWNHD